jgi:hypothetical protein
MCWNSETHNKEVVRFCQSTPLSTSGVLIYVLGSVQDWKNNTGIVSSCNARIFSASFDTGSESAVSIDRDPVSGKVRLLEVHVGASFQNSGTALEYDGLVIDSFDPRMS